MFWAQFLSTSGQINTFAILVLTAHSRIWIEQKQKDPYLPHSLARLSLQSLLHHQVFPAGARMNRRKKRRTAKMQRVRRVCGGEQSIYSAVSDHYALRCGAGGDIEQGIF